MLDCTHKSCACPALRQETGSLATRETSRGARPLPSLWWEQSLAEIRGKNIGRSVLWVGCRWSRYWSSRGCPQNKKIENNYPKKNHLCLCWVFIAVHGLSIVVVSRNYPLVVVQRLLITATSLVVECGRSGVWASEVVVHRLSCLWRVESSQTGDRTCVHCIGWRILNQWTTREIQTQLSWVPWPYRRGRDRTSLPFKEMLGKYPHFCLNFLGQSLGTCHIWLQKKVEILSFRCVTVSP